MTNREKILNKLFNSNKELAKLLIVCENQIGWDEIISYRFITSDRTVFTSDFPKIPEEAIIHEVEWLNQNISK